MSQTTQRTPKSKASSIGLTLPFDTEEETVGANTSIVSDTKIEALSYIETNIKTPPAKNEGHFGEILLGLASIDGLGRKGILALDKNFGLSQLRDVQEASIAECLIHHKIPSAVALAQRIHQEWDSLTLNGQEALAQQNFTRPFNVIPFSRLPDNLRMLPDAPRWLFVEGNQHVLYHRPAIALVGTRKASEDGLRATQVISEVASAYPISIVSGLAEGIDEHVHFFTLQRHCINVAFLGHGVDSIFPAKTADLRKQIVDEGGAVATEYLPNEKYQKEYFVQRNRLQAGLADMVIPIEAESQSGTAHTVRFAQRYSRPLVGINWPGANGILKDIEQAGGSVVDIFTLEGRRQLDSIIKRAVIDAGKDAYPFRAFERRLILELKSRNASTEDLERLLSAIRGFTTET